MATGVEADRVISCPSCGETRIVALSKITQLCQSCQIILSTCTSCRSVEPITAQYCSACGTPFSRSEEEMMFNPARSQGGRRTPGHEATWFNSFDEHGQHGLHLGMLFGLPVVWCAKNGDVLALIRNPTTGSAVSVVPASARTPGLLGAPVAFRQRFGYVESGPYVLQVGTKILSVWKAHRLTDATWEGGGDEHRTIVSLKAEDLGFSEFINCFGWVNENRLIVAGFKPNQQGAFGLSACRVELRSEGGRTSLRLAPDAPVWIGSGTEDASDWHGMVIPEGAQSATAVVANRSAVWPVPCRGVIEPGVGAFRSTGAIPLRTTILSPLSLSLNLPSYLCITEWPDDQGRMPRKEIERLDLRDPNEATRSTVVAEPIDWAKVVRTAGSTLLVAAREDSVILARDFTNLGMGDWATIEPLSGTRIVASSAGPDYLVALGISNAASKPFLLVAPLSRGPQVYSATERPLSIDLLREGASLVAGPESVCLFHQGGYQARAHVFPLNFR